MSADLHCHSIVSDGSTGIEQIVSTASKLGLDAISITDHDDFAAHNYIKAHEINLPITVIKGAEISTRDFKTGRRVHILCYLPKNTDALEDMLKQTREKRKNEIKRSMEIISKHYPIDFEMLEARREKYGGYFKQHIMQFLMEAGYCDKIFAEPFFKIFNKKDGLAPTHVEYPNVYDVLEAIKSARGVAVMAHPAVYDSFELLQTLCRDKLIDGIEVCHPKQNNEEREFLRNLAEKYGLLQTGGTDFHGYNTTRIYPLGTCTTSDKELKRLFEIAESK